MKKLSILLILLFSITVFSQGKFDHSTQQNINQNHQFNDVSSVNNTLYVHNIDGFIEVEGYDGDKVKVSVDRSTWAKTQSNLEAVLNEALFEVVKHENDMHLYIKTPYNSLDVVNRKVKSDHKNYKRNRRAHYHDTLNYTIKVPRNVNLNLRTINNGHIKIDDVQAKSIAANNINGEIHLDNVSGHMDIKTINGDVSLSYVDNRMHNANFESINGSFDVQFVEKPNIEVLYESMNGHFYSNIELATVSTAVKKDIKKKMSGVKFSIKPRKKITIGTASNTSFTFKTLNGDISLTQQS